MPSSRLDDLRMVDPVLTTIAQTYSNASMVGEFLFPTVTVSKLKGKVPVFGKEAFVNRDMYRAVRAQSNRIAPSDIDFVSFETLEKDIEMAVDYIEEEESEDFSRMEQRIAKQLTDIIQLDKEREAAGLVQNPDNYISDLKLSIDANHAFDDYTKSIDPVLIIRECMSAVRTRIARYPNTMIIGDSAFQALSNHPMILDRVKYSGLANVNTNLLSEILGIPAIHVGLSVHSADGSTFEDVWGDNIILAYVDRTDKYSRNEFNPSFGYTFQRKGMPEIDSYYENGGKIKIIRNTDNYGIKVTAPDAGFLIYNTNHL